VFKKDIKISFKKDPSKYDLVVIGSPVWAFHIPPFTKAYLKKNKFNKVAFFCTYSLMSAFLFPQMRKYSKKPLAKLKVHMTQLNNSDGRIKAFCTKLVEMIH
jgi:menaquinone-dependent protoporphyrinogen IX oxidase